VQGWGGPGATGEGRHTPAPGCAGPGQRPAGAAQTFAPPAGHALDTGRAPAVHRCRV